MYKEKKMAIGNIRDNRPLLMSPVRVKKNPAKKGEIRKCRRCGNTGHNSRTCKGNGSGAKVKTDYSHVTSADLREEFDDDLFRDNVVTKHSEDDEKKENKLRER